MNDGELPRTVKVRAGDTEFEARVRIDTPKEAEYFRHGGILPYVLRSLLDCLMPDVLIWGDTIRSPELRHEIPLAVGDPFLYLEADGRRAVVTNALEVDRIAAAAPGVELHPRRGARARRAHRAGLPRRRGRARGRRACRAARWGRRGAVPPDFPLALADRLREAGVVLRRRRRVFSAGGARRPPSSRASAAPRGPGSPGSTRPRGSCAGRMLPVTCYVLTVTC